MQDNMIISPVPNQLLQQAAFHMGVVRDVKDPEGKGRVRVEVPSIWGQGEGCWSYWCEVCSFPVGSAYQKGDHGVWWVPVPGERVLVGFIAGQHQGAFCIPGPIWQWDDRKGEQVVPTEVHAVEDEDDRRATRLRIIKSEAGHTILMDDAGTEEAMAVVDWSGAGLAWDCPGKKEDVKEEKGGPSYGRIGEIREGHTVFSGTNPSASQLSKTGIATLALLGVNGSGMVNLAKDGEDKLIIFACKNKNEPGPSIILDAKDDSIYLTAGGGKIQIILDGKTGDIRTTRQIIKEVKPIPVKEFIIMGLVGLAKTFMKYIKKPNRDQGQMNPKPMLV